MTAREIEALRSLLRHRDIDLHWARANYKTHSVRIFDALARSTRRELADAEAIASGEVPPSRDRSASRARGSSAGTRGIA